MISYVTAVDYMYASLFWQECGFNQQRWWCSGTSISVFM